MIRSSSLKYFITLFVMAVFFSSLGYSQAQSKQVLPGIFREENIQFKKAFKMNGKDYVLYFIDMVKTVRPDKNIVSNIYLIPNDYSYIEKYGESMNYPPLLIKFIYHDLGDPEKTYCTAVLHERRCDKDGNNSEFVDYEVRLPDDIATTILELANGETDLLITDRMAERFSLVKE